MVHATITMSLCCGGIPKAVGPPLATTGVGARPGVQVVQKPSKNKTGPCPSLAHLHKPKIPKWKRVTSFLSKKGLLKETTNCKLPSLLLLLFLDGYKDSVKSHT